MMFLTLHIMNNDMACDILLSFLALEGNYVKMLARDQEYYGHVRFHVLND